MASPVFRKSCALFVLIRRDSAILQNFHLDETPGFGLPITIMEGFCPGAVGMSEKVFNINDLYFQSRQTEQLQSHQTEQPPLPDVELLGGGVHWIGGVDGDFEEAIGDSGDRDTEPVELYISAADIEAIRGEFEADAARLAARPWYGRLADAVEDAGKTAAAGVVGFLDALTAVKSAFGSPVETPLPWPETEDDNDARRGGYMAGMAANAAMIAGGTAAVGDGLATAATCGGVAGGGLALAETGAGIVVAAGGGVCALGGLGMAAAGTAATTVGGANMSYMRGDYGEESARRTGKGDRIGRNGRENRQFADAGRRVLRRIGVDPASGPGKDILRRAHDILAGSGMRAGGFQDLIMAIEEAAFITSGAVILVSAAE